MILGDISTPFLHAGLQDDFYVWPPKEFYPDRTTVWKLKRALYGLRDAPRAWQEHFAQVLQDLGGKRFKSDANLYYFDNFQTYLIVYVDDLMLVGLQAEDLLRAIKEKVLLRQTGVLRAGVSAKF